MEPGEIYATYGRYFEILKRLSSFPLYKEVSLKDLELTKAERQMSYRDLWKWREENSVEIIDYLCNISADYVALQAVMAKGIKSGSDFIEFIAENYELYEKDVRNLLRFSVRRPSVISEKFKENSPPETELDINFDQVMILGDLETAKLIYSIWYLAQSFDDLDRSSYFKDETRKKLLYELIKKYISHEITILSGKLTQD